MKKTNKIKLIAAAVLFLTVFSINAQNNNVNSAGNYGASITQGAYVNGCYNVRFTLPNDCYAIIYAINNKTGEKTMLVDGDISAGTHGVMFKTNNESSIYNYILEVKDSNINIFQDSAVGNR